MLRFSKRKINEWRRRRTLALIRRKFAESGYPLDELDDLNIEVALTRGKCRIEQVQLTSKLIYFALRWLVAHGKYKAIEQINRKN